MKLPKKDKSNNPYFYEGEKSLLFFPEKSRYDTPVIIKYQHHLSLGISGLDEIENEYLITHNLKITGVRKALEKITVQGKAALVLEYVEGDTLKRILKNNPIELKDVLKIAVSAAHILVALHKQNIVHRNISNTNILISPIQWTVILIDFGIATKIGFGAEHAGHTTEPLGSLPYLSPEQTGRMNLSVDHRSDLYSLGVVLYEMLTGSVPFETDIESELLYSHIAKSPLPVSSINPSIPSILSDIVDKLLEKDPENRYQSAFSLSSDLIRCQEQLSTSNRIEPFELAGKDYSGIFSLPSKCQGRHPELKRIKEAYQSVKNGASEVILVTGDAGVGKSFLVNEFQNQLSCSNGCFISGTYNVYPQKIPYSAITEAFGVFVEQLLVESSTSIDRYRTILLQHMGSNGALLTNVVPKLELIIGKQPSVTKLGPNEAQVRFNHTFLSFIKAIASIKHPLVIFIDNLQWADNASIRILNFITSEKKIPHLLFIFAYRTGDEVGINFQKNIEQHKTALQKIVIGNFSQTELSLLISNALTCNPADIEELTGWVHEKTDGNPLFALQFVKSLCEEKLLFFSFETGKWIWEPDKIREKNITDNVARLMVQKINKLPDKTRELLSLASCIGNGFNSKELAWVAGIAPTEVPLILKTAIEESIIAVQGEVPKPKENKQPEVKDIRYVFSHGSLRQAANDLIPKKSKKSIVLHIGRLLLQNLPKSEMDENTYLLANLLNEGFQFIQDEQEVIKLCELNLLAGMKSKEAASYKSAIWYLSMGIGILPSNKWEKYSGLTVRLYLEAIESEYLSGNFDRAELLANEILNHTRDIQTKIKVYELRILFYTAQYQYKVAIDSGIEALQLLDVILPGTHPGINQMSKELDAELSKKGKPVSKLQHLPVMDNKHQLLVMRILSSLTFSAHQVNHTLFPAIITQMVLISVKEGNSPFSALAYAWYAVLLCKNAKNISRANEFGELATTMLSVFNTPKQIPRITYLLDVYVKHWKGRVKDTMKSLHDVYCAGIETGNLEIGILGALHYCNYLFLTGNVMGNILKKQEEYCDEVNRSGLDLKRNNVCQVLTYTIDKLKAKNPQDWQQKKNNPLTSIPFWTKRDNFFLVFNTYFNQTIVHYFNEDYKSAVESAQWAEKYKESGEGFYYMVCFRFYQALSLIANFQSVGRKRQKEYQIKIDSIVQLFLEWCKYSPANCLNKYALIYAELSRMKGDNMKAIEHYGIAIKEAKEHGYTQEEAMGYECEAQFYISIDREDIAGICFRKALDVYNFWGAGRKSFLIEEKYKYLLIKEKPVSVDSLAIVNASMILSQELRPEQLLGKLIKIVIENAGAEKGILLENRNGHLVIQAKGETKPDLILTMQEQAVENSNDVPVSAINYVARTLSPLVLNNASRDSLYNTDSYIKKHGVKSLLCLPIVLQGKLMGILYVENNLSTHVFTQGHLELLQALSSQAAISIENARLYANLENNIKELKSTEEALREREGFLSSIIENIPNMIFIKEAKDLKFVRFNKAGEELLGLERDKLIGKSDFDFFPREQAQFFVDNDRKVLQGRKMIDIPEEPIHTRNGERILHTKKIPVLNKKGLPAYLLGISEDITELKRAEEERMAHLQFIESLDKINRIIQGTNDLEQMMRDVLDAMLLIFDSDRAWLVYPCDPDAPSWQVPMERTKPAYPGAGKLGVDIPMDDGVREAHRRQLAADGPVKYGPGTENPLPPENAEKFGYKCFISMAIYPKIGSPWQFGMHQCSYARQWTAQEERLFEEIGRRIADAITGILSYRNLQESEQRYRIVFKNSPVSILEEDFSGVKQLFDDLKKSGITDIETYFNQHPEIVRQCVELTKIVDVNIAAIELHEARAKENLVANLTDTFITESFYTFRQELIALWNGETKMVADSVVKTLKGTPRNVTVYFTVCPGYEESLAKVLVSLVDITERKQAEEENQKLNRVLEQRVIQRTSMLAEANKELEAFSYSVSHDLRAPLRHINSFIKLLERRLVGLLDEKSLNYMANISDASKQMGKLIEDLLSFSRMARHELSSLRVDFNALVQEVIKEMTPEIAGRDIQWEIAELPKVTGDQSLLRMVMVNLISNAIKYTIPRKQAFIEIGFYQKRKEYIFFVRDNGVGFNPKYADKLFGVFQRLHPANEFEGTGIGLANVHRIITRHGGKTWAEGEEGKGATFYFSLSSER